MMNEFDWKCKHMEYYLFFLLVPVNHNHGHRIWSVFHIWKYFELISIWNETLFMTFIAYFFFYFQFAPWRMCLDSIGILETRTINSDFNFHVLHENIKTSANKPLKCNCIYWFEHLVIIKNAQEAYVRSPVDSTLNSNLKSE